MIPPPFPHNQPNMRNSPCLLDSVESILLCINSNNFDEASRLVDGLTEDDVPLDSATLSVDSTIQNVKKGNGNGVHRPPKPTRNRSITATIGGLLFGSNALKRSKEQQEAKEDDEEAAQAERIQEMLRNLLETHQKIGRYDSNSWLSGAWRCVGRTGIKR